MKSLVEGECSRPNALVELSRKAGQSNARLPSTVRSSLLPTSSSIGDDLANEYLTELSRSTTAPSTFSMQELAKQLPEQTARLAKNWSDEYLMQSKSNHSQPLSLAQQWTDQYTASTSAQLGSWVDKTWEQVSSQTFDSESASQTWPSDYLANFDQRVEEPGTRWIDEYLQGREQPAIDIDDDLFQYMENEWEALKNGASTVDVKMPSLSDYEMTSNNPYLNEANSLEDGQRALMSGDLPSAVLHFEAAVQRNPQDSKAWCMLGQSQAENERDLQAIAAFNKSLEIDPRNLEALLALSVSYANESMENSALSQLERWLSVHPVYGGFEIIAQPEHITSPFLDQANFKRVEDRFLAAAQHQPEGGDASLQNALGILYNLNRSYERAIDSIKAALSITPNDARLWNRLGATLANGDRTTEAISAYRQALALFPAYVRARYNLGISCMHLSSYNDAIEHFISALELQQSSSSSSSIWQTLRSAIIRSGLPQYGELLAAVDARDLMQLKRILAVR
ncbi:unnamed protein product [Toxocara canis]|uniref:Peroxisomal targeting signal 1 receptor n=1 Tax=Toxocara canis TaxID=6265 RepID=A0A183UEA6_TOXCA|nr:unnamed protein product [Toxocara canis]